MTDGGDPARPGPGVTDTGPIGAEQSGLDGHKLAAARLWATNRFPYLASALFASPALPAPGLGRIVIDRWWRVHADPAVIAESAPDRIGGELLHLASHVLRDHAERADQLRFTDPAELHHWVDAADAEIADDFPVELERVQPAVVAGDLACPDGRLAEEYYRTGQVRDGELNDCGSGAHGDSPEWEPAPPAPNSDSDPNSNSDADSDRNAQRGLNRDEQQLVRRNVAAEIARSDAESVPEGLRRWAEEMIRPTVDWRAELAALVRREIASVAGAVDYSYRRPSRRRAAMTGAVDGSVIVLPALQRPTVEVAVVCDTSASVSDELLGAAVAEVDGLMAASGTRSVRMLSVDDAVNTVARVTNRSDIELVGGGGTDMTVGIAAAMEQRPQPELIVVLTDGYTPWPDQAPRAAVVVGLLGGGDHGIDGLAPVSPPEWARTVTIDRA